MVEGELPDSGAVDFLHLVFHSSAINMLLVTCHACSMELSACGTPVEPQELGWLASALFNVGVDLHGSEQYAAAAAAMQASLAPAVASLCAVAGAGSSSSEVRGFSSKWCVVHSGCMTPLLAPHQQRTPSRRTCHPRDSRFWKGVWRTFAANAPPSLTPSSEQGIVTQRFPAWATA